MKQVKAEVISNQQILGELKRRRDIPHRTTPRDLLGSWLMWLKCPEIADEAKPGQFVMIRCGENVLPRPFSIHQINKSGIAIFFGVWEDGKGTKWLSQLRDGNPVELFGPLGNGFSINATARNLLMLAGGNGVAPFYFLSQRALQDGSKVKLLYGASGEFRSAEEPNPSQFYPKELFPKGLELEMIKTTPDGLKGMVTDLLTPHIISQADQIFACGPLGMYRAMVEIPELKGRDVQVSLEVVMGCGAGVCYGCTIKTKSGLKQACKDGPVFQLDEIMWVEWSRSAV